MHGAWPCAPCVRRTLHGWRSEWGGQLGNGLRCDLMCVQCKPTPNVVSP